MNKTILNSQKEKHSMLSLRRATSNSKVLVAVIELFLSTLSLRRATEHGTWVASGFFISIHALLAEQRRDQVLGRRLWHREQFLSTLSLRRATHYGWSWYDDYPPFRYPRSPCGERPYPLQCRTLASDFYPRSPCGERPGIPNQVGTWEVISITLSLRRATHSGHTEPGRHLDFYPRSPCGERPAEQTAREQADKFLSTLSLRRATMAVNFYPHLLAFLDVIQGHFYPRSPCGERPISIHAAARICSMRYFYPRSPCGATRRK